MHAASPDVRWASVTVEQLEGLQRTIENQKGQLALALGILLDLGFDPNDLFQQGWLW